MTNDQRNWQMDIAVRLMEEVIADVLAEAHHNGESPLSPWDIHTAAVYYGQTPMAAKS